MKIAKILPVMGLLVLSDTAWGQMGICHSGSGPNHDYSTRVDPNLIFIGNPTGSDPIYFCKKSGGTISETIAESRFNTSSGRSGSGTVNLGSAQGSSPLNTTSITLTKTSTYGSTAGSYTKTFNFNVGTSYPDSIYNFMTYHNPSSAPSSDFCSDKQEKIINYLQSNPQIFLVNGNASGASDISGNYVAKNVTTVEGATVTTYFKHSGKVSGNRYSSTANATYHYIYCLVSVVPDITINLDTLKKAGTHRLTYSVRSQ